MKRLIALLLTLGMCLALFAGCGGGGAPTSEGSAAGSAPEEAAEASAQEAEAPAEEAPADIEMEDVETEEVTYPLVEDGSVEFEYWLPTNETLLTRVSSADDLQLYREMEKITGIHVNLDLVAQEAAATTFPLMIAGGDYPDVWMDFRQYVNGWDHAVEEGIIASLNDYLPVMPNLNALLTSDDTMRRQCYTDSGYFASIPAIRVIGDGHQGQGPWVGYTMRKDWLDQMGMDVPKTYDDMEQVLLAMQTEFPNAAHPFFFGVGFQSTLFEDVTFYGGYNITKDFIVVDGQVRYSPLEPGYKEYVEMMHRWYEEGLLHPDFMSVLLPALDPKDSAKGEYGVFGAIYTWYDQFVEANDKNFELVGMTPLKNGPDGEVHVGTLNPMVTPTGAIAADAENIELICKWWDYLYGEEGIILGNWGIEGETYEVKENGEKTWIGPFLNPDNDPMFDLSLVQWQYLVYNTPGYTQVDREYCLVNETALAFVDAWSDCGNDYNYPMSATMTADETEAYAAGFSDLDTYVNEMSMKFVIGDEDLSQWDSFIDTVNSMNVEELIGYKQAALDRYNNR